jgi:hypothetical protein
MTARERAAEFLRWLTANDLEFHLDDDPREIWPEPRDAQKSYLVETYLRMKQDLQTWEIWEVAEGEWPSEAETCPDCQVTGDPETENCDCE